MGPDADDIDPVSIGQEYAITCAQRPSEVDECRRHPAWEPLPVYKGTFLGALETYEGIRRVAGYDSAICPFECYPASFFGQDATKADHVPHLLSEVERHTFETGHGIAGLRLRDFPANVDAGRVRGARAGHVVAASDVSLVQCIFVLESFDDPGTGGGIPSSAGRWSLWYAAANSDVESAARTARRAQPRSTRCDELCPVREPRHRPAPLCATASLRIAAVGNGVGLQLRRTRSPFDSPRVCVAWAEFGEGVRAYGLTGRARRRSHVRSGERRARLRPHVGIHSEQRGCAVPATGAAPAPVTGGRKTAASAERLYQRRDSEAHAARGSGAAAGRWGFRAQR